MNGFILSVFNVGANFIDGGLSSVVLLVAFLSAVITEFAAGLWDYRIENTSGGLVCITYGVFSMSFAAGEWRELEVFTKAWIFGCDSVEHMNGSGTINPMHERETTSIKFLFHSLSDDGRWFCLEK